MSNLRRYNSNGHPIFVTCVTEERQPILTDNADLLRCAIDSALAKIEGRVVAFVIMPDHFHAIIETADASISDVMHDIKLSFGALYRKRIGAASGRVWQNRFWDHHIRDQEDMNKHVDYIHLNPVKHGLVADPFEWKYSTIEEFRLAGMHGRDWGQIEVPTMKGEYGE